MNRRLAAILVTTIAVGAALAYLRDPPLLADATSGLQPWLVDADQELFRWTTMRASFFVPSTAEQMTLPFRVSGPRSDQPVTVDVSVDGRWLATVEVPDRVPRREWVRATLPLPRRPTSRRFRRVELRIHRHLPQAFHQGVQMGKISY